MKHRDDRNEDNELLTVQEVAHNLRVDQTTVRRWIKNGSLSAVSFPEKGQERRRQNHRIKKSVIEDLLTTRRLPH